MTWRTHLMGGVCSLAPLVLLPPDTLAAGEVGLCALLAALGSLLPDLDASESHLKHLKLLGTSVTPFTLPAIVLNRTLGHRGLLHSLLGLGIVALFIGVPLALFMGPLAAIAL